MTDTTLTADNIYDEIVEGNNTLDNAEVQDTGRVLIVTPDTYLLMKKCKDIIMETDISAEMRLQGVIANLDGLTVIKVPKKRLPENFGFMIPPGGYGGTNETGRVQNPPGPAGDQW